jgi:Tfp pilus assembly protein PilF
MPRTQERAVPHGGFTDHWIRVTTRGPSQPTVQASGSGPIEPFYSRDRTGPDADIYRGMGEVVYATLANSGRALSNAASALDGALNGDTVRSDAHFLLGVAYQQLGRTDDAIRALERSVRIDSGKPDRLRALAVSYERAGHAPGRIDSLYRRALAIQPALAWIRADYADFLQAQNRRAEAKQAYARALAEQPSLAAAWFNLGTLLTEEGQGRASGDAFRHAIALDPSLAAGLSMLLDVRATSSGIAAVRAMEPPLPSLPIRDRGPRAVQLAVAAQPGPGVSFTNVPPRAVVQVMKPDGTLLRSLPTDDGRALYWNLLTDTGQPIAGGLYRVQVQGRDLSGRPITPPPLYFGVVRHSTS